MLFRKSLSVVTLLLAASAMSGAAAASTPAMSCDNLPFPGSDSCLDYTGSQYNPTVFPGDGTCTMPGATGPGAAVIGAYCDLTGLVGTCTTNAGAASETQLHFFSGAPAALQNSCVSFMRGTWSTPLAGSCEHQMVFGPPGTPASPVCKQYNGDGWDATNAASDCSALTGGVFHAGLGCADTTLGTCTLSGGDVNEYDLYFYYGDAAALEGGCEGNPPYGLGGVWTSVVVVTLPAEVVDALSSDASVTVTPDACVTDDCLADLVASNGFISFAPADGSATTGLVIYPGGMVEPRAYAVAARAIAAEGYLVVLMPFAGNLPITDPMRGLGATMAHPWISTWAVAGHSLGGVAASIWAKANPMGKLSGIAFWASYPAPAMGPTSPAADLSTTNLKAVSVTGTLDTVLSWDNYNATKPLLPAATRFASIRGGNHAQFGYYGDQTGDTTAAIGRGFQHELFVGATVHMLGRLGVSAEQDVENPIYATLDNRLDSACKLGQLEIARMRLRDLRTSQISNQTVELEAAFQTAKPSFPTDGSAKIAVATHLHQVANPFDITAPAILDGEVWCKMKSQEAIKAQFNYTPAFAEGSCRELNIAMFAMAMAQVERETLAKYLLSGTYFEFAEDAQSASGPEWLGQSVELSDLGDGDYAINASALRTPLVGPPPPYNGSFYCRVWSVASAVRFMEERAATVEW